jgi:hypothetical protein
MSDEKETAAAGTVRPSRDAASGAPVAPRHPERICRGCDKYCAEDDLACGNGTLLVGLGWIYGTAGLAGFLAQVVVGIQGRLLPMYGWYRMLESGNLQPPARSAHTLASHGLAKAILLRWALGVPLLAVGLTAGLQLMIALGSAVLLAAVALNATQTITIVTAE